MADVPQVKTVKDIIREEILHCAMDPAYFMFKYVYIQHPVRGKLLFDLYDFQRKVLKDFDGKRFNIILKSRQLGISTLSSAYALWLMLFHNDKKIIVIATKQDVAKNIIAKIRYAYKELPSYLKIERTEDNTLSQTFKNGSNIVAKSASDDAGRSDAVSLLIVDEAAFIGNIDKIWTAASPALSTGGNAIVLSTPNGVGNWFWKMWTDTMEGTRIKLAESEDVDLSFNPIFLPWQVHPEHDQKWRDLQDVILKDPRLAKQECFDGDTKIYTRRGLRKISEIKPGDLVLTHTGKFKPVLKVMNHIADSVTEFNSFLNRNYSKVTSNHPFNCNDSWIEFEKINTELVNSFPLNIEIEYNKNNIFDLFTNIKPLNFESILSKDGNTFYVNDKKNKTIHNRNIVLDKDLGYFVGLYLAEGHKCRLRTNISFNYETELNTWVPKLINIIKDKFGIESYQIRHTQKSGQLTFCSEIISSFLSIVTEGTHSYNKKLSKRFYDIMNFEFILGILNGYFCGDGLLKTQYRKSVNSVSKDLIYDIRYLSNIIGLYQNSIKERNRSNVTTIMGRKIKTIRNQFILSYLDTKNIEIKNIEDLLSMKFSVSNNYQKRYNINDKYISSILYKYDMLENIEVFNLEVQDDHSYVTEHCIVHNCDCDFLASGNTVVPGEIIQWYKDTYIKDPTEKTGPGGNLWRWSKPDYSKSYVVSADVSRGDSTDFSTAQVFDVETCEQVAEFKGMIDTKEFGNFLVSLATDYNDALLVIENANIGWAVLQQVIDRNYKNLYYTVEKDVTVVEGNRSSISINKEIKKRVPGFSTTSKTRPMVVEKIYSYFKDRGIIIHSLRLIDELFVFIWNANRAEAMTGHNDDLVMGLGIGLFVRDTALKMGMDRKEMYKAMLNATSVGKAELPIYIPQHPIMQNPWAMQLNEHEDLDLTQFIR